MAEGDAARTLRAGMGRALLVRTGNRGGGGGVRDAAATALFWTRADGTFRGVAGSSGNGRCSARGPCTGHVVCTANLPTTGCTGLLEDG
jgi:hypothetical protein